jgi:hypothetical protein
MGFGMLGNRLRFQTIGLMLTAFGCIVWGLVVVVFAVGGIEWDCWFGGFGKGVFSICFSPFAFRFPTVCQFAAL